MVKKKKRESERIERPKQLFEKDKVFNKTGINIKAEQNYSIDCISILCQQERVTTLILCILLYFTYSSNYRRAHLIDTYKTKKKSTECLI